MLIPSENKNSKNLEKEIISTLIFYKILNVPCLTIFELYRRLINNGQSASIYDINESLSKSSKIKLLNGFYYICASGDNDGINYFNERTKNTKISAQKIKKAKKIANLLSIIPFVRSIGISGSVSMNSANPESDIDFFIISSKKRVWLTRLFTVALTQLIGQRRHKNIITDKICLNIYIADERTKYPIKNMANSQMILMTLPIYNKNIFNNFLNANAKWMSNHIANLKNNLFLKNISSSNYFEKTNKILNGMERFLEKTFSSRIFHKTPNAKPPYIVINDDALLFHYPRSKNVEVTEKYNRLISQMAQ